MRTTPPDQRPAKTTCALREALKDAFRKHVPETRLCYRKNNGGRTSVQLRGGLDESLA